jgi:RND superfamily putative drug exporter
MSRIREEWDRTGDNALAVADGLAATARVITAAAAIMVAVFLSFVLGDERIVKLFGLGLASAIFIDATIVRMVLVPSVMELIGPANWWLPRWLDRRLPHLAVDVSDPVVQAILDHEDAAATGAGSAYDPISGNGRRDAPTAATSTRARPGPGRSGPPPGADTSGRSGSR